MVHTVSATELVPVLVEPNGSGGSDVWLRKNIEEAETEEGQTVWEADEVHLIVSGVPSAEDIDLDSLWYDAEREGMTYAEWRADVDAALLDLMELAVG